MTIAGRLPPAGLVTFSMGAIDQWIVEVGDGLHPQCPHIQSRLQNQDPKRNKPPGCPNPRPGTVSSVRRKSYGHLILAQAVGLHCAPELTPCRAEDRGDVFFFLPPLALVNSILKEVRPEQIEAGSRPKLASFTMFQSFGDRSRGDKVTGDWILGRILHLCRDLFC